MAAWAQQNVSLFPFPNLWNEKERTLVHVFFVTHIDEGVLSSLYIQRSRPRKVFVFDDYVFVGECNGAITGHEMLFSLQLATFSYQIDPRTQTEYVKGGTSQGSFLWASPTDLEGQRVEWNELFSALQTLQYQATQKRPQFDFLQEYEAIKRLSSFSASSFTARTMLEWRVSPSFFLHRLQGETHTAATPVTVNIIPRPTSIVTGPGSIPNAPPLDSATTFTTGSGSIPNAPPLDPTTTFTTGSGSIPNAPPLDPTTTFATGSGSIPNAPPFDPATSPSTKIPKPPSLNLARAIKKGAKLQESQSKELKFNPQVLEKTKETMKKTGVDLNKNYGNPTGRVYIKDGVLGDIEKIKEKGNQLKNIQDAPRPKELPPPPLTSAQLLAAKVLKEVEIRRSQIQGNDDEGPSESNDWEE